MAAAVGAVLMIDDHKDDIAVASNSQRDWLVAEAVAASSSDSAPKRVEHFASDEPARAEQAQALAGRRRQVLERRVPDSRSDEHTAVIETPSNSGSKAAAEQVTRAPEAPPELPAFARRRRSLPPPRQSTATADTLTSPPLLQGNPASETKSGKDLSLILDSILTVRLPEGASEQVITQAIDKVLESVPHGEDRRRRFRRRSLARHNSGSQQGSSEPETGFFILRWPMANRPF